MGSLDFISTWKWGVRGTVSAGVVLKEAWWSQGFHHWSLTMRLLPHSVSGVLVGSNNEAPLPLIGRWYQQITLLPSMTRSISFSKCQRRQSGELGLPPVLGRSSLSPAGMVLVDRDLKWKWGPVWRIRCQKNFKFCLSIIQPKISIIKLVSWMLEHYF